MSKERCIALLPPPPIKSKLACNDLKVLFLKKKNIRRRWVWSGGEILDTFDRSSFWYLNEFRFYFCFWKKWSAEELLDSPLNHYILRGNFHCDEFQVDQSVRASEKEEGGDGKSNSLFFLLILHLKAPQCSKNLRHRSCHSWWIELCCNGHINFSILPCLQCTMRIHCSVSHVHLRFFNFYLINVLKVSKHCQKYSNRRYNPWPLFCSALANICASPIW